MSDELHWYYSNSGDQSGPISGEELQQLANSGAITPTTSVWCEGMAEWLPASQIENLFSPEVISAATQAASAPRRPQLVTGIPNPSKPAPASSVEPWDDATPLPNYPYVSVAKANYRLFLTFNLFIPLIAFGVIALLSFMVPDETTIPQAPAVPEISLDPADGAGDDFGADEDFGEALGIPKPPEPSDSSNLYLVAFAMVIIGLLSLFIGVIHSLILLHRAWRILQPVGARTTPGKAVGLKFIPLFNLYWNFVAYYGLAEDWNKAMTRFQDTRKAPLFATGNFLTYAICAIIFPLVALIMFYLMFADICRGINFMASRALRQHQQAQGIRLY